MPNTSGLLTASSPWPPESRVPARAAIGMGPRYAAMVVAICDALSAGRAGFERHDHLRRGVVTLEQCLRGLLAAVPRTPTT